MCSLCTRMYPGVACQMLTFVLFETFALLKVPQLELVVKSARQDEPAIGRKPDKGNRRVGFINQGLEALATIAVPDAT